MFKNVATSIALFAFDATTGLPKTGDAANITAYVSKDYGSVTVLGDTSATEMDATNAKGWYLFAVAQAETNADALLFTAKSSTANISVVGQHIFTTPANFSSASIDSNGRVDVIKVAGTTQTAKDIGAAVPAAAAGASGGLLISGSNSGTTTLAALTVTGSMTISDGLLVSRSTSNASAITATGNGTGHGLNVTSGSGASGNGINVTSSATNGHAMVLTSNGNGNGLYAIGGSTGAGIKALGGSSSGAGMSLAGQTSGAGLLAQGAGTGNPGISALGVTNAHGLNLAGAGTGAGALLTGGATGIGLSVVGGATSGDGIKVTTTSGHGINLAPVGTSMHGLFATGGNGGTSDGIKAAAGTGGVDFRANQTGNLTGTVATLTTYTGNTPQTGDAYARLGAPVGASISADIAAVKAQTAAIEVDTAEIGAAGAGLTALASAASLATVDTVVGAIKVTTDKLDDTLEDDAGTYRFTANALEEAPSGGGGGATAAEIADEVQTRTIAAVTLVNGLAANVITAAATAADFTTEIQAGLATAAALATVDDFLDTEIAAIKAKTDNLPSDPADASDVAAAVAAVKLYADRTVIRGTVSATAPTTTGFTASALSPAGAAVDQFKGRIIIFDNDTTTVELRGQATDITSNTLDALPSFTFSALTDAPQSGDTFSIV